MIFCFLPSPLARWCRLVIYHIVYLSLSTEVSQTFQKIKIEKMCLSTSWSGHKGCIVFSFREFRKNTKILKIQFFLKFDSTTSISGFKYFKLTSKS